MLNKTKSNENHIISYDGDEYGIKERQNELLQMMKDVDEIFNKYGIKYSLYAGSLLGAIRHKGFIPWDDDIDIMVDRDNYDKILALNDNDLFINNTSYYIVRYLWIKRIKKNKNANLIDPSIDIFVIDNCPDNLVLRKTKQLIILTLQGMMHKECDFSKFPLLFKICLFLTYYFGKLFCDDFKYFLYDKISQIGNKKETKYVSIYNGMFKHVSIRFSNKLFVELHKHNFEDKAFFVTEDYDSCLKNLYGNYMIPPKKEERIPMHAKSS